ncbi:MAG: FkbM family methyltransferase [Holosporaceae bacterium]|jgi:FkbM family methyltransferase|nr:FkbM family methyltransferase [Holosporaceae bacterium]
MIFQISKYAVFCIVFVFGHVLCAETETASSSEIFRNEAASGINSESNSTSGESTAGIESKNESAFAPGEPVVGIESKNESASVANESDFAPGDPVVGIESKSESAPVVTESDFGLGRSVNEIEPKTENEPINDEDLLGDALISARDEEVPEEENIEDFIENSDGKYAETKAGTNDSKVVETTPENLEIYAAPLYNKLIPVSGWDRYSCDSATTVSQWLRWWKYLRLHKPLLMSWIEGSIIKIYPHNEVCRALFVKGIYGPNQTVVVNTLLQKGSIFIDAGANAGYATLLASQVVGKEGRIIALEPCQRDFERLVENIKINKLEGIILAYRYAVSQKKGRTNLLVADEETSSLNTLGIEFSMKGVAKDHTEGVDTISIDELVAEEKITGVDVLNLDIEGSEFEALQGARKTIEKYRPALVVGLNSNALKASGSDQEAIGNLLKELKYRAYKIVESPAFALQEVENVGTERANVIFCLHESVEPPQLPQPEEIGIWNSILRFFR